MARLHKSGARLLILMLLPLVAGCGVLFGGTTKSISITSAPSAATINTQPPTNVFTTPTSMELERKNSYTITASREGYRDATAQIRKSMRMGPLILDILFTGLLGVVVDAVTGGWWDLQPDNVTLVLEQTDPAQAGPDVITVMLSFQEAPDGLTAQIESSTPVRVRLEKN